MMNVKVELYLSEHTTLLEMLTKKLTSSTFNDYSLSQRLIYIEGLRSYRRKIENKLLQPPKKKRAVSVSIKTYQICTMTEMLQFGSLALYGSYEMNIIRQVCASVDKQCVNFEHHLKQGLLQIE